MKMSVISATIKPVLAAALLSTSIACGSQPTPTGPSQSPQQPSPIPQPAPIPQPGSDVVPASNGGIPGVDRRDVVISHSGTATVILRWGDADYSLQLYVTSGICTDVTSLLTGGCTILGRTRPGDLPGVVATPVTSGDRNTIWVLNTDAAPQSFTIVVELDELRDRSWQPGSSTARLLALPVDQHNV